MRWHFVDRIEKFEPWREIISAKAISLEEYYMLERFGRKGALPESLLLENCVETSRWLVAASSGFEKTCILSGVEEFRITAETGPGDTLSTSVAVRETGESMRLECAVRCAEKTVAEGVLEVKILSLSEHDDIETVEGMWKELYGAA